MVKTTSQLEAPASCPTLPGKVYSLMETCFSTGDFIVETFYQIFTWSGKKKISVLGIRIQKKNRPMFTLFIQIKCCLTFRPKLRSRFHVADICHKIDLGNKYEKPRIENNEVF